VKDFELKFARFQFSHGMDARRRLWIKLAKLLGNGVPILDALKSMYDRRIEAGRVKDPVTIAIAAWIDGIRNGHRLAAAVEGWVPHDEQMLINAGEQSGRLNDALMNVSEIMVAKAKIRKALIGGLAYPVVMFMIAMGVLIMFSYKIIPEFAKVVPDEKWHGSARIMIDFANFTRDWLVVIVLLIVMLIVALFMSFPRWSNGLRIKLDRFPPYNIYRMLQGSAWTISLAALVSAGMRVEAAVQQLSAGASDWLADRSRACLRGMRSGLMLGDALARSGYGFPDMEIIDDLGVYSRLSGIDQALSIIGKEWITASVENIQGMMKIIFGISVLVVGLIVAGMVGGLIGMELQMTSIVQSSYR
jgi:type II secretory pathway component PulF